MVADFTTFGTVFLVTSRHFISLLDLHLALNLAGLGAIAKFPFVVEGFELLLLLKLDARFIDDSGLEFLLIWTVSLPAFLSNIENRGRIQSIGGLVVLRRS